MGGKNSKETNRVNNIKQASRVKVFIEVIKRQGCMLCGYSKCLSALEFHHVGNDKQFDISRVKKSLLATKSEIAKCVCVCANCHREIHSDMVEGIESVRTVAIKEKNEGQAQLKLR